MATNNTLPKNVETYIDNNLLFNKFGIVNIRAVKASTKCEIPDDELTELVKKRFAKEFKDEHIEFI